MKLKNLVQLFLIVIMVSIVGCKQGPDKLIAKTWKVTNVVSKGTYNDSTFQAIKANLLKVEMTFKDNKYTMSQGGTPIETGTYTLTNNKLVVTTEKGMNMDAIVTKDNLTLDTPDFMTNLLPK